MPAKIVHFEIPAKDATRAKKFYGSLFGWSFKDAQMPGMEYYLTEGTEPGGAISPVQDGQKGVVVYFDTEDIDASVRKVRELGGKADDSQPIPGVGYFAACTDLDGNPFSLYKDDPTAKMEQAEQEARA